MTLSLNLFQVFNIKILDLHTANCRFIDLNLPRNTDNLKFPPFVNCVHHFTLYISYSFTHRPDALISRVFHINIFLTVLRFSTANKSIEK